MSQSTLAELYVSIVQEKLGLVATIDDDGDVVFKYPELGHMFIAVDALRDPEVLQVVMPSFLGPHDVGLDRTQFLELLNRVNARSKGARVVLLDGHERASAVCLSVLAAPDQIPDRKLIEQVLPRLIVMIRASAMLVVAQAKALANQAPSSALLN